MKKIVTDLRSFTHPGTGELEDVKVGETVDMARRLLSHEWKADVQIHQQIPDRLVVEANRSKLVQVFVNLLLNSIIACKQGGKIAIQTHQGEGGEKVSIEILDDGPGFPEEYLERAFDPFFTTRPGGTGLGLSISKKIILSHGGTIEISNRNGKGAKVTITLPVK